jgi:hypothetical protein
MSDSAQILPYEQHPEPPYLVREPGRVALVLPAVPRWLATAVVVVLVVMWCLWTVLAAMVLTDWWRLASPSPGMTLAARLAAALPLAAGAILYPLAAWWVRAARVTPVLEVCGGELVYTSTGLWGPRVRRTPLSRVRDVRIDTFRARGNVAWLRVRVRFVGRWTGINQRFLVTDPKIAAEARFALAQALSASPSRTAMKFS